MLTTQKFTMRISEEDRERFAELARLLRRNSQSDAIRYVVHETLKAFQQVGETESLPPKGKKPKKIK